MTTVNVTVRKGARVIATVERPIHLTAAGPAVRFRRRLWLLDDSSIDISGPNLEAAEDEGDLPLAGFEEGPDASQAAVISLPAQARALVSAGPGTGKTHVACSRIAQLINGGVAANKIWVVSFTRTAIVEFRNRIAAALDDPASVASVCIRTLDSHAWAIQSGFSGDAKLSHSYDDNIRIAAERLRTDDDASDYARTIEHLVIDEAQDILGGRAEFLAELIDRLAPDAGVTAFADDAQSIYGFTEEDPGVPGGRRFIDLLKERSFNETDLVRVHRTSDPRLRQIFTQVRKRVLARVTRPAEHCTRVRDEIVRLAHEDAGNLKELSFAGLNDNTLVLVRSRADVLERSSHNSETPHRLRMSGLPARLLPWIGAIFWDFTSGTRFTKDQFDERWRERVHGAKATRTTTSDEAWSILVETAGVTSKVIDVGVLRRILARPAPPMLFCSPEFGDHGPILGTVHASKGREADHVCLFLAPLDEEKQDLEEEARVGFVGATRARQRLSVGKSARRRSTSVNGRVYRHTSTGRLQVEIGRAHDISAAGLVGTQAFATAEAALEAQSEWSERPLRQHLIARQNRDLGYEYELLCENEKRAGVLSSAFKSDMGRVAQDAGKWPAAYALPYIRSIGIRSLVLPVDHEELQLLHDPWRLSGFLIAPLLTGYSSGRFGKNDV